MKILIAEDDLSSRLILEKLLTPYGDVQVEANGTRAVRAFQSAIDENNPYDLLCLDIEMPEMDGHQVLKQCRKIESENGIDLGDGTDIIMTTIYGDKINVLSSFKEGCEGYIVKPVTKEDIAIKFDKLNIATSKI